MILTEEEILECVHKANIEQKALVDKFNLLVFDDSKVSSPCTAFHEGECDCFEPF